MNTLLKPQTEVYMPKSGNPNPNPNPESCGTDAINATKWPRHKQVPNLHQDPSERSQVVQVVQVVRPGVKGVIDGVMELVRDHHDHLMTRMAV